MAGYSRSATWYDALSAEPIYGSGRNRAIPALHLQEGSRVLDVGCGTGLNFPLLLEAVGESGQVVGVDHSPEMLEVARRKTVRRPPGNVVLVEADAEQLGRIVVPGSDGPAPPFDAVLFTYSLSLMGDWEMAWRRASSLVRRGGRAAIVDMEPPHGWARLLHAAPSTASAPACPLRIPSRPPTLSALRRSLEFKPGLASWTGSLITYSSTRSAEHHVPARWRRGDRPHGVSPLVHASRRPVLRGHRDTDLCARPARRGVHCDVRPGCADPDFSRSFNVDRA